MTYGRKMLTGRAAIVGAAQDERGDLMGTRAVPTIQDQYPMAAAALMTKAAALQAAHRPRCGARQRALCASTRGTSLRSTLNSVGRGRVGEVKDLGGSRNGTFVDGNRVVPVKRCRFERAREWRSDGWNRRSLVRWSPKNTDGREEEWSLAFLSRLRGRERSEPRSRFLASAVGPPGE